MKTRAAYGWLVAGALVLVYPMLASAQQKVGWVDTQEIMKQYPDAVEAQSKLDALVAQWQVDINKQQTQFQQEADDYQKRRLILPEQARIEEEAKLGDMQKKISDLRNQRFGQNGDLFQQQNALMRPIQEKVLKAIQDVAKEGSYDYIFDKSGQVLLMFANDKYDVTQDVINKLKTTTNKPSTTPAGTQTSPPGGN